MLNPPNIPVVTIEESPLDNPHCRVRIESFFGVVGSKERPHNKGSTAPRLLSGIKPCLAQSVLLLWFLCGFDAVPIFKLLAIYLSAMMPSPFRVSISMVVRLVMLARSFTVIPTTSFVLFFALVDHLVIVHVPAVTPYRG